MTQLRAVLPWLLFLPVVLPAPALAHLGMLRPVSVVSRVQYGNLAPAAGLEYIGSDALAVAGLYSVGTGARLTTLKSPLTSLSSSEVATLLDIDGDGIDEVVGVAGPSVPFSPTTVGVQHYVGGDMVRVFSNISIPSEPGLRFLGTMRLSASEPHALVFDGEALYIVGYSGALLYDGGSDAAFQLTGAHMAVIGDFLGNGYDQIAVDGMNGGTPENYLIGESTPAVGVAEPERATRPVLMASRPNPSQGPAQIAFELPGAARVRLSLYDTAGRLVNRLADGTMPGGRHDVTWDGRDLAGRRVAGGVYFYELRGRRGEAGEAARDGTRGLPSELVQVLHE